MSAEAFLSRLQGVRRTGPGSWIARCPAHPDRTPSLTVREVDDGRVLVHCFTGCEVEAVIGAVGLEWDALFPPRMEVDRKPGLRQPFLAADVVRALGFEALLVATAAANLAHGVALAEEDRERLMLAAERIAAGVRGSGYVSA